MRTATGLRLPCSSWEPVRRMSDTPDLSVMAVGRDKGMPLISLAGLIRKTALGVFVPKGSGLKTPKDLEGKEIIYTATSFEGPFLDAFFKAGGTSRDKINLVSVDAASKISAYVAGKGDGMVTTIPYGIPFMTGRPSDSILFADFGLVLPSYGLVVRTETLAQRRPALERLVKAFLQSWQAIIDGGEKTAMEAADIIIKRRPDAKLNRAQMADMILQHVPYFYTSNTQGKPLGWQADADWKATVAAMEEAKVIKPGSKSTDYYTNDLIIAR